MVNQMVRIGSLFSGIGGFELGLENSIPGSKTIWQVEKDPYCQRILKKHWPMATLYEDITTINANELAPVDVICGGFPCQDISNAGKGEGIQHGNRSGLFWEMWKLIGLVRPRIVIMENVAAITCNGLSTICGAMAKIGYDTEWCIVSASQFGAPHQRRRWFAIANAGFKSTQISPKGKQSTIQQLGSQSSPWGIDGNYWNKTAMPKSVICGMDDGVSNRVARLKALGNAIVPQCSEHIGLKILNAGLLDDLL